MMAPLRMLVDQCQFLVEGALGSGKTSLAYHYCQKWAEGNLSMFDVVALVYLRHPAVHSAGLDLTLHQLLLLPVQAMVRKR